MALIPATILTGFLGSGKTTLLKRVRTEAHGQKIAVSENECGDEDIDSDILVRESGDVAGAAALVNQIRSRVNLPNTSAANQADMRLAIEKERRLELAFEGHRWYDLKRTGRAITVINAAVGANGENLGYSLNENRLLWPIPQAELDKNTKLTQNPGY